MRRCGQASHHLMSVFEFATEAQVDDFYTKITNAFTSLGNANMDTATARDTEWQITRTSLPLVR